MRFRSPIRRIALACSIASSCAVLAAPSADARTETLRWTHEDPSRVAGFRIFTRLPSGQYGAPDFEVMPIPEGGVYSHTIDLADQETRLIVVSAYDAQGVVSPVSNERVLVPPPTGSVLLFDDFEDSGSDPLGWFDTDEGNSMVGNDALFSTTMVGGSRALTTASDLSNIHSHYVVSGSDGWSSYEFSGRMRIAASSSGIGVTSHSRYPNGDAYYRLKRQEDKFGGAFFLKTHPLDHEIECDQASTDLVPEPGVWIRFRFQVVQEPDETAIRAVVWPESSAEPATWQLVCRDTRPDRFTAGTVGVWSGGGGQKYWDDLEVSTLSGSPDPTELSAPGQPALISPPGF